MSDNDDNFFKHSKITYIFVIGGFALCGYYKYFPWYTLILMSGLLLVFMECIHGFQSSFIHYQQKNHKSISDKLHNIDQKLNSVIHYNKSVQEILREETHVELRSIAYEVRCIHKEKD